MLILYYRDTAVGSGVAAVISFLVSLRARRVQTNKQIPHTHTYREEEKSTERCSVLELVE